MIILLTNSHIYWEGTLTNLVKMGTGWINGLLHDDAGRGADEKNLVDNQVG